MLVLRGVLVLAPSTLICEHPMSFGRLQNVEGVEGGFTVGSKTNQTPQFGAQGVYTKVGFKI